MPPPRRYTGPPRVVGEMVRSRGVWCTRMAFLGSGEHIDPTDWRTLEPHFAALLLQDLAPDQLPAWLARWSALQKVVLEQNVVLLRERARDLTVEEHQAAYRRFTSQVLSPFALANQA